VGDGLDEGRAMLQLIHDLAPGAQLFFHTAIEGPQDFADGINALAEAGCDVIVDDIGTTRFHARFSPLVSTCALTDDKPFFAQVILTSHSLRME